MEDSLRDVTRARLIFTFNTVLILVLMEDSLRVVQQELLKSGMLVLILVLMEDSLRD